MMEKFTKIYLNLKMVIYLKNKKLLVLQLIQMGVVLLIINNKFFNPIVKELKRIELGIRI